MKTKVNVRFLAILFAVVAVLGGGLYALHGFQVRRNAAALLQLAREAEGRGDLRRAVKYLELYLAHAPDDNDARASLGLHLARLAGRPEERRRALQVLDLVVRRSPQRGDARRALVDQAMHPDVRRFADARVHLQALLQTEPHDGAAHRLLAQCLEAEGEYAEAEAHYRAAIRHAPAHVASYALAAHLLRQSRQKPREADQMMDDLVAANDGSFRAWLARARYLRHWAARELDPAARQKKLEQSAADVRRAHQLAAHDADVLLEVADLAEGNGKPDDARAALRLGITHHPRDARLPKALARVETQAGRHADAVTVLRQGSQAVPRDVELQWALATLLVQTGEAEEAQGIARRLRKGGFPAPLLDFLDARALLQRGEWLGTSRLLEKVAPLLVRWPEVQAQAHLLLGRCYEQLGDDRRQLAAFQAAARIDPFSEPACLGVAAAYVNLGKLDQALEVCRLGAFRSGPVRLMVARLLLLRTLQEPPARRQWGEVEQYLAHLTKATPDAPELAILRAEVLAGQDRVGQAGGELEAARDKSPKHAELWAAGAAIAQRQNNWQEALNLLDQAETRVTDRVTLRLARARLWAERGGKEAREAIARLEAERGHFSGDDWRRLVAGLAEAWLRLEQPAAAERLYRELAEHDRNHLGVRIVLFDLALRAGNEAGFLEAVADIRTIEGDDGTLWRFAQACLLLRQAQKGDKQALHEAGTLLALVAGQRAGWPRLALAQAEFHELNGRPEAAIRCYQEAVAAGERSPDVIRRAVRLLHQRRRFVEADDLLGRLQDREALLGDLGRAAAEVALFRKDTARALELARKAVAADSKDHAELIWLGHVLCAANRWPEAEPLFRRALALAEQSPEAWVALVQYLARVDRKAEAEALIAQARGKLPADQALLAADQCHELLGQFERAAALYEAALAERPHDLPTLRHLARFALLRQLLPQAEKYLRAILDLRDRAGEDVAWARRLLAIVLVAGKDHQQARDALAVLGIVDRDQLRELTRGEAEEDLRVRAIVLAAQQGLGQRRAAIKLLESLPRKQARTDDQFLLAQLYESVGDWTRAREQFRYLTAVATDNPLFLAHFAGRLLHHKQVDEAEGVVARLRKVEPDTLRTLRLEGLVLKARGKSDAVVSPLQKFASANPEQATTVAALLDDLGQPAAAEELFRKATAAARRPEDVLLLAIFLGRQNRPGEALRLCEAAWKTCPRLAVADTCLQVLAAARDRAAHCATVARQLETAIQQAPEQTVLVSALAAVRRYEGRTADAVKLYREVVARNTTDPQALNNLAWLLALVEGKGDEAQQILKRAVAVAGPVPTLLDTRAVVYLAQGKAGPAVKDLEEVVTVAPSPARYYHLARAHALAGNRGAAGTAMNRACELGLTEALLDPLELPEFRRLSGELAPK
jgi:tetratricopeptide (TPR) repeat protein